jgi:hypothetical protein
LLISDLNYSYTEIQVSSAVPEGKGVSSSASVEVASMSAIAAAHGNCYSNSPKLIGSSFFLLIYLSCYNLVFALAAQLIFKTNDLYVNCILK